MKGKVISACDRTTKALRPWANAGYECWAYDIQHSGNEGVEDVYGGGRIIRINADVRTLRTPHNVDFFMGWPPCTDMSVSGARWFQSKGLRSLSEAIDIFGSCVNLAEALGCPGVCENPVSVISSHYRKPDFIVNPYEFAGYSSTPDAEAYTKKTCLWGFHGFKLPPKRPIDPVLGSKMHLLPPSEDRGDLRSVTPEGLAVALFVGNAVH